MPPTEANGKQVVLVDAADEPIKTAGLPGNQRKAAALQGNVYNPATRLCPGGQRRQRAQVSLQPVLRLVQSRVGLAWNPHFDGDTIFGHIFGHDATVIRGGYGRALRTPERCRPGAGPASGRRPHPGRAVPPGVVIRSVRSGESNRIQRVPHWRRRQLGSSRQRPAPTLPQPDYPGINASLGSASEAMDPNFRPNDI